MKKQPPHPDALYAPALNIELATWYVAALNRRFGHPALVAAAYNAGGGRVRQWRGEWGDVPTDEYVERIPFKETREYVKRVMGTWQTMRFQFDAGPAYPDLSKFNGDAVPE